MGYIVRLMICSIFIVLAIDILLSLGKLKEMDKSSLYRNLMSFIFVFVSFAVIASSVSIIIGGAYFYQNIVFLLYFISVINLALLIRWYRTGILEFYGKDQHKRRLVNMIFTAISLSGGLISLYMHGPE